MTFLAGIQRTLLPWVAAFSRNGWAIPILFGAMALVFALGLVTGRYGRVVRRPLGLSDRACGYMFGAGGVLFVVVGLVRAFS